MLNVDSLVQKVHTFSKEIGLEFGIKKCWMLVLKHGKIANKRNFTTRGESYEGD